MTAIQRKSLQKHDEARLGDGFEDGMLAELGDHSRLERAELLRRHARRLGLLADDDVRALERRKAYTRILEHRAFAPRALQLATDARRDHPLELDEWLALSLLHLDHPDEAWSSAYSRLPPSGRALLHVIASFPGAVVLEDLAAAYAATSAALGARDPFEPVLRRLRGEFVETDGATVWLRDAALAGFMAKQLARDRVAARAIDQARQSSNTAVANAVVDAVPPRSRVRVPAASVASKASISLRDAAG
jgi:hypothetical protein